MRGVEGVGRRWPRGSNGLSLAVAASSRLGSSSSILRLGLVADPVIEAIARPEFEDGLRTGVHHGGCWGP